MRIAVVIPSLDEIQDLPKTIESLLALNPPPLEIAVSDGGSSDGTLEWLTSEGRKCGITVVQTESGRGVQMNAGARATRSDAVLFLHADATLAADALERVESALRTPDVLGGAFTIRFARRRSSPNSMPVIAAGINLRTILSRTATGDQAIFVRRTVFDELGGFKPWPLFEDVDFVSRIKGRGRFVILRAPVTVSDRRYARFGPWRTTVLMWALRIRYWRGTHPEVLKRDFVDVRTLNLRE
jgi:rSAM/selenodomain-associated transferase 2